jgi:hypothetical protein
MMLNGGMSASTSRMMVMAPVDEVVSNASAEGRRGLLVWDSRSRANHIRLWQEASKAHPAPTFRIFVERMRTQRQSLLLSK